jgi:hypothetical protein
LSNTDASSLAEADELMSEPGDGVRFAATGGVLNQVTLAGALLFDIGEQPMNHVQLVIPRWEMPASTRSCGAIVRRRSVRR